MSNLAVSLQHEINNLRLQVNNVKDELAAERQQKVEAMAAVIRAVDMKMAVEAELAAERGAHRETDLRHLRDFHSVTKRLTIERDAALAALELCIYALRNPNSVGPHKALAAAAAVLENKP